MIGDIDYKIVGSAPFIAGITLTQLNQGLATVSFLTGITYTVWRWRKDLKKSKKNK